MPRNRKDVEAGLKKKGFIKSSRDHHYFTYHTLQGRKTAVFTKTSHGKKELSDKLLSLMARQCRLRRDDFLRLIDCPLTRSQYEAGLAQAGHI
jgi:predicted RNA binding protein YcfA (HicA-like mRNA interferase family)